MFAARPHDAPNSELSPSGWPGLAYKAREWTPAAGFGVQAASGGATSVSYRASVPQFIADQPNVSPPMRALVDAGIVKSNAEHQPGPFWRTEEILEAVDSFAKRAGRRQRI